MKRKPSLVRWGLAFAVLILLTLLGCSKSQPPASTQSPSSSIARPTITFVESSETRERNQIEKETLTLFTNKDYAGLEALAAKYRSSKDRFASGVWKLLDVYSALEPSRGAADSVWQARLTQVQEWAKLRPGSVMPKILLGRIMKSYAWEARGAAWAEKVKDKNWPIFFSRLQSGLTYLQQAKRLKEKCPIYWSSLQWVALGLQFEKDRYDAIFQEAIREYPDYNPIYTSRAVYLLPRWNGDEGEWEKDLAKSADRVGGDEGDVLYARGVWEINHYAGSDVEAAFKENKSRWTRADKGFGLILKQFPDSLQAKLERAYLAGTAGEKEKAQAYFGELNGQVDLRNWDSKEEFERFVNWLFSK